MLSPFRVLDLTDEKGQPCGKMLADLGADVIKVERPGGDPARDIGPFVGICPHRERSLFWFAFNTSKRSITLDIKSDDGNQLFRELVRTADFVIESFDPGYLDGLGLGYDALRLINPKIILTSITPFGQSGPFSRYKGPDMICWAMGGHMYLCGDDDRPPVQIGFPQAYMQASMEGLAGTLIAHYYRETSGQGQHVDVSAQQAGVWSAEGCHQIWLLNRVMPTRHGPDQQVSSGVSRRIHYACKDGCVAFGILGSFIGAATNKALVEWMDEEGMASDYLKQMDWNNFDMAASTPEQLEQLVGPIGAFFAKHTKSELQRETLRRRILFSPINTAQDLLEDEQLRDRNFWEYVRHPGLGIEIGYPGPVFRSTEKCCHPLRRAPHIGENNQEVFCAELGLSTDDLVLLKHCGAI